MIEIEVADLANPYHADSLVRLMDAYARGLSGVGQGLSDDAKRRLPDELSKRSHALVLLAWLRCADEQPEERIAVGLAVCFEAFSTFACKPLLNVHDVIVAPELRRRGIAKKLFERVEQISSERGCCKLTLEVLEGNHAAIDLYRSLGFQPYQLDPTMGRALFWHKEL